MPKKEENEDNVCHWLECLTQFDTAEDLFNHVCTQHIGAPLSHLLLCSSSAHRDPRTGRKSAGTLSLECKWTAAAQRPPSETISRRTAASTSPSSRTSAA